VCRWLLPFSRPSIDSHTHSRGVPSRICVVHNRAYGCVYKAKHRATEQIIAIKTVLVGSENEGAAEIKKEIEILRHCRHPNIVCLYGCTEKARELWVRTRSRCALAAECSRS